MHFIFIAHWKVRMLVLLIPIFSTFLAGLASGGMGLRCGACGCALPQKIISPSLLIWHLEKRG